MGRADHRLGVAHWSQAKVACRIFPRRLRHSITLRITTGIIDRVEFEAGATRFSLHSIPPEIADQIRISSPPRPREENPVKLSFEVDDIASERQRAYPAL